MNKIAVFCGSNNGTDQGFRTQAQLLGNKLANESITLIYGGAKVGLMGAVADGVLDCEGQVVGVLPRFLAEKELAHDSLTEIILVDTMHERKAKMYELCDGIIALPGGFGTMEELFEMLTWAQLGLHSKPIAILNTGGYYDTLIALIETMIDKGFVKEVYRKILLVGKDVDDVLIQMLSYTPPENEKWYVTN